MEELLRLCMDITAQGEYKAHFSYSGHIECFTVSIDSKEESHVEWIPTLEINQKNLMSTIKKLKEYLV